MTKLFELTFADGTALLCCLQNDNPVYTYENGMSKYYKEIFEKIKYKHICHFAYTLSHKSDFVKKYRDFAEENSNKIAKLLQNKFK